MKYKSIIVFFVFVVSLCYTNITKGNFTLLGVNPTILCEGNSGLLTFKVSSFYAGYSYRIVGEGIAPSTVVSIGGGTEQSIHIPITSYVSSGIHTYNIELFALGNPIPLHHASTRVTFRQSPVFIVPLSSPHVCPGETVSVKAQISGIVNSYRWERTSKGVEKWTVVGTSPALDLGKASSSLSDYKYRCKVKNNECPEATSNIIEVFVGAVTVNQEPQDVAGCDRSDLTLEVEASGKNIQYQWEQAVGSGYVTLQESQDFTGVTTSSLQIKGKPDIDGKKFRCKLTSSCGDVVSRNAIANIIPTPVDPVASFAAGCVGPGAAAKLTIANPQNDAAYHILSPSYTILKTYTHEDGKTPEIVLDNLSSSDNWVMIYAFSHKSKGCTSNHMKVSMSNTGNVIIGKPPVSLTICDKEEARFSVNEITGQKLANGNLGYEWQVEDGSNYVPITPSANISGINNSEIIFQSGFLESTSQYHGKKLRCKVSGTCGITYSDPALLKIREPLAFNYTIDNVPTQVPGAVFTIPVKLNSVPANAQYGFYTLTGDLKATHSNTSTGIETNVGLSLTEMTSDIKQLNVTLSYHSGPSCEKTETVTLPNTLKATLVKEPQDVRVTTIPSNVTFECESSSSSATYSWFVSTDKGVSSTLIPRETSKTLRIVVNSNNMNENNYYCRVTNGPTDMQYSRSAIISIIPNTVKYNTPISKTICDPNEVPTVTVGNAIAGYTYRWERLNNSTWVALNDGSEYTGTTTPTLTIIGAKTNLVYKVRCSITVSKEKYTTESAELLKVDIDNKITKSDDFLLCVPNGNKAASLSLSIKNIDFATYTWNTGATTHSINVYENNKYSVTINAHGCSSIGEIEVTDFKHSNLNLDIEGSSHIGCTPDIKEIQTFSIPKLFKAYEWSSSTSTLTSTENEYAITVYDATKISVKITDRKGCSIERTLDVTTDPNRPPNVEYIKSCEGNPALVQASSRSKVTLWQWYDDQNKLLSEGKPFAYFTQEGRYVVKCVYNDGCRGIQKFTVEFSPSLVKIVAKNGNTVITPNANGETIICEGDSVSLSTNILQDTYVWTSPTNFLGREPSIKVANEGRYEVVTTQHPNNCPGRASINIRHLPSPQANIAVEAPKLCTNTPPNRPNRRLSTVLYPNATYLWSTGSTTPFTVVDQIGTHEYSVKITSDNGCSREAKETVTLQDVSILYKEAFKCASDNSPLSLEGTEGENGQYGYYWSWKVAGTAQRMISPEARKQSFIIKHPSEITLKITESGSPACFIEDVLNVNIGVSPTVSITGSPSYSICSSGTVTLNANAVGATSLKWTYNNTEVGTNTTLVASKPGIYAVIASNAAGCSAIATQEIKVTDFPNAVIQVANQTCPDAPVELTATVPGENPGEYSYSWIGGPNDSQYTVNTSGVYTVRVVDNATQCHKDFSKTVTFLPQFLPTVVGDRSFDLPPLFTVSVLEKYVSYEWCNGTTSPTVLLPENTNCFVRVTDEAGCQKETPFTTQGNFPIPMIDVSGTEFCEGTKVELKLPSGFKSYQWHVNSKIAVDESKNTLKLEKSGTYKVLATIQDFNGNSVTTPETTINIKPSPDVSIKGARTFCSNMPFQFSLEASDSSLQSYEWLHNETPLVADPGAPHKLTLYTNPSIEGVYTLSATAQNGCTTTVTDSVLLKPSKLSIAAPTVACLEDSIDLKISRGLETYSWKNAGIEISTKSVCFAKETGRYTVRMTDRYGCSFTTPPHSILFSIGVSAQIIGPSRVCIGDSIQLQLSEVFAEYLWSTGETTPAIYVKKHGTYSVTGTTIGTCKVTASADIYERTKYVMSIRDTTCIGTTYNFGGLNITQPGTYQHTFPSIDGCDSTVTLRLAFVDPPPPIEIELDENAILHVVDFKEGSDIDWSFNDELILGAFGSTYEPLANGLFRARSKAAGNCATLSNVIPVNVYSKLDLGVFISVEQREDDYTLDDIVPFKIVVSNESTTTHQQVLMEVKGRYRRENFILSLESGTNSNWKSAEEGEYGVVSRQIRVDELRQGQQIEIPLGLIAKTPGKLVVVSEVKLLEDAGKFAKEYAELLYNNTAETGCYVKLPPSALPNSFVMTKGGNDSNRCVIIEPSEQFSPDFYDMEVYVYNRAGQQVFANKKFQNRELCADDFPTGVFVFVMIFQEKISGKRYTQSGTITCLQ